MRSAVAIALCLIAGSANAAIILDRVTVVDTRTGALRPGQSILIADGKIVRIARKIPDGGTRIDARGKFVVPGYLDMHAHPLNAGRPDVSLPLMVANGITGYRQMAGNDALLAARRAGTLAMPPVAPELLAAPGTVFAGPLAGNPQAAAAEVRRQAAAGADFIKIVDLAPPAFVAVADAAAKAKLPFAGHLSPSVDVRDAVRRGIASIEHLGPQGSLLEACSTDEAAIRQAYIDLPVRGIPFDLPPAALKRLTANPTLLIDAAGFKLLQRILDTYDDAKCRALAKTFAVSRTWQVPTLIRVRAMELGDDASFTGNPDLRYVPADDRALWQDVGRSFTAKIAPDQRATLEALFKRQLQLTKMLDRAGVKMLAGSDFGGQWLVAGASLHSEFDLLAEAGLSPLRVLQLATLNGARFLGREARMGTVEAGKDANLVLLDANPIAGVANLHRIAGVVRSGTYYARADLDAILKRAEQP